MTECAVKVHALNWGCGTRRAAPCVAVALGEEIVALTPNGARLLIRRLERAIEDCEMRRKTGGVAS